MTTICHECAHELAESGKAIRVRTFGSLLHGSCMRCRGLKVQTRNDLILEVDPDTVRLIWGDAR